MGKVYEPELGLAAHLSGAVVVVVVIIGGVVDKEDGCRVEVVGPLREEVPDDLELLDEGGEDVVADDVAVAQVLCEGLLDLLRVAADRVRLPVDLGGVRRRLVDVHPPEAVPEDGRRRDGVYAQVRLELRGAAVGVVRVRSELDVEYRGAAKKMGEK